MIEILLIIALMIAILLDIIRVYQYIAMRERLRKDSMIVFGSKIDKLYYDWLEHEKTHCCTLGDYCKEHWNDDEM